MTIPEGKNTLLLLVLSQTPIRETLDIKWYVYSQPKNSYGVLRDNLVYFNWGDPLENLRQHPLEITYIPDTTDTTAIFRSLSVKGNAVYADDTVVFNAPASK